MHCFIRTIFPKAVLGNIKTELFFYGFIGQNIGQVYEKIYKYLYNLLQRNIYNIYPDRVYLVAKLHG